MWRCRCSRRAKRRWQCGHGSVLVLVAEAFLLTRDPLVDWEASIAQLALGFSIDGVEKGCGVEGGGWMEELSPSLQDVEGKALR